jgi:DNA-binding MarR family transcriptional regulator
MNTPLDPLAPGNDIDSLAPATDPLQFLGHEARVALGAARDDHAALRLWLRLLTCTNLVEQHIRTALREQFDATLPRFDLMAQLERHPEGLTMGALSKRLMVTGGNVTGIADQLAKDGLIVRERAETDKRAMVVKLTRAGHTQFARMAKRHEEWVVELFEGLNDGERDTLFSLLAKLKASAGRGQP